MNRRPLLLGPHVTDLDRRGEYEGGERRLDVIEFMGVAQALGQEPVEMFGELVRAGEPSR